MKKTLALALAFMMIFALAVPMSAFGATTQEISVYVNNEKLTLDQAPIIEDGRTLVPLRAIFEALDVDVEWQADTKTVVADWVYDSLSLQIGKNVIKMGDGHQITIDVPAKIVNGRTLVPARAVAEAMGANVSWDGINRRVDITKTWSTYYVRNVEEFVAAIGSNHKIQMAAGTYNISEYLDQIAADVTEDEATQYYPNVIIEGSFDGRELCIFDVTNLMIEPAVSTDLVTIVTEPRYSDVLIFSRCEGIYLSNLTLGHTPEKGSCAGSVLKFDNTDKVRLSNLDLYGCGTYGIEAQDVDDLIAEKTTIRDCSYGVVYMYNVSKAMFNSCTFKNCEEYTMFECDMCSLYFTKCAFSGLKGGLLGGIDSCNYRFTDCTFDDDAWAQVVDASTYSNKVIVNR